MRNRENDYPDTQGWRYGGRKGGKVFAREKFLIKSI